MVEIEFEYKDAYTRGNWSRQSCRCESVEQCKKFYGLDNGDVEYHILSVKKEGTHD